MPTVDGPSHTYNAWILKELVRGSDGPVAEWFRIDRRPHPNWERATVTLRDAGGRVIAQKPPAMNRRFGMWADLVHELGASDGPAEIEVDAGEVNVWALVSVLDPARPAPSLYVPR